MEIVRSHRGDGYRVVLMLTKAGLLKYMRKKNARLNVVQSAKGRQILFSLRHVEEITTSELA
jgi:hypothetical protein